jgi:hypothetical protein
MYEKHKAKNDLYGQVIEVMEFAFLYHWSTEKMREMIQALLSEHAAGDTDKFWREKVHAKRIDTVEHKQNDEQRLLE